MHRPDDPEETSPIEAARARLAAYRSLPADVRAECVRRAAIIVEAYSERTGVPIGHG